MFGVNPFISYLLSTLQLFLIIRDKRSVILNSVAPGNSWREMSVLSRGVRALQLLHRLTPSLTKHAAAPQVVHVCM